MLANPKAWGLHALLHIPQLLILSGHILHCIALHCIVLRTLVTSTTQLCGTPTLGLALDRKRKSHLAAVDHMLLFFSLSRVSHSWKMWKLAFSIELEPWWQFPQVRHFSRPVCLDHIDCTTNPALRGPVSSPVSCGTGAPYAGLDRACTQSHHSTGEVAYLMISVGRMSFLVQLCTFSPSTVQWERQGLVEALRKSSHVMLAVSTRDGHADAGICGSCGLCAYAQICICRWKSHPD